MRMTYANLCKVCEKLTRAYFEAFVAMAEGKGCHGGETKNGATATYPKMMPRQHIGSGSSWRYRCKRKRADVRNMLEMVGCSCVTGFPRVSGKRGGPSK